MSNENRHAHISTTPDEPSARSGAAPASLRPARRILQTAIAAFLFAAAAGATAQAQSPTQFVIQPNEAASKDAKVYGFLPATNFQSNLGIIGSASAPHFFWSLLQFNIYVKPSLITSASLELYVSAATPFDGTVTHSTSLHQVTGSWGETTVNVNNFPAYNPVAVATQTNTAQNVTLTFDVTSSIASWGANPGTNNGWALIPSAPTNLTIADAKGITGDPTKAPRLTLNLAPFTDTKAPAIAFTGPTTSTVTGAFNLTGTVNENYGLSNFAVKLNGVAVSLDAPLLFAAGANTAWQVSNVVPENGANIIEVTATDLVGLTRTVTRTVTYVNPALADLAGSYTAVLTPSETPNVDTTGVVTATVSANGGFTGSATLGGVKVPFSGTLKNNGAARFKPTLTTTFDLIDRTEFESFLGTLALSVNGTTGLLGTLSTQATGGTVLASFAGGKAPYSAQNLVAANATAATYLNLPVAGPFTTGRYTVSFASKAQTPSLPPNSYPQGDGYATLTLSNTGSVALVGSLADGTTYSAAAKLRADGTVPLFTQLYRKRGALAANLAFDLGQANTDASATDVLWVRPAHPRARYYPAGWENGIRVDAAAAKYAAPVSLNFGQGEADLLAGNASLVFTDGGLSSSVTKAVSVAPANGAVKLVPALLPGYKLSLAASTGVFTGTFTHTDSSTNSYRGILLNKGANKAGFGYFLSTPALSYGGSTAQSGGVSLDPSGPPAAP